MPAEALVWMLVAVIAAVLAGRHVAAIVESYRR